MLKIHKLLLSKFIVLFLGTFLLFFAISYTVTKEIIIEENKNHLEKIVSLVSIELDNSENLDSYVQTIYKRTFFRAVIIDSKGIVLADTDKENIDNDYIYASKYMSYKDENIEIRLLSSLSNTMEPFYNLWIKLTIAFIVMLGISFYITNLMSRRILHDIEQLKIYLEEVSRKNYEAVVKIKYFHEFLEISLLLKNIIKRLNSKGKKK